LTQTEWEKGLEFLTVLAKTPTSIGEDFILLSDLLGVSALVDVMHNPRFKNSTEGCLLGPAFTRDAPDGAQISDSSVISLPCIV